MTRSRTASRIARLAAAGAAAAILGTAAATAGAAGGGFPAPVITVLLGPPRALLRERLPLHGRDLERA